MSVPVLASVIVFFVGNLGANHEACVFEWPNGVEVCELANDRTQRIDSFRVIVAHEFENLDPSKLYFYGFRENGGQVNYLGFVSPEPERAELDGCLAYGARVNAWAVRLKKRCGKKCVKVLP